MEIGSNEMNVVDATNTGAALNALDAAAVDAIFGEGVSGAAPERVARLEQFLGLLAPAALEPNAARVTGLTDATMARALRTPRTASVEAGLRDADAAAVDALVENGWNAEAIAGGKGERARRVARTLSLLGGVSGPNAIGRSGPALVEATLAHVQSEVDRRAALMQVSAAEAGDVGRRGRFTLSDLVSVAAMLVFMLGVMWPMAASWRESARIADCEGNLAKAGAGFEMYARDHSGRMPIAAAGFGGAPWWQVGDPEHSHSANLFTLARTGYTSLDELSCAGNPFALLRGDARSMQDWASIDQISFSYQLPARNTMAWGLAGNGRVVVLSDRSPVIERARRGERFDAEARSMNHRGRGQNVLMSDGSVIFLTRPVLPNGDNIWLPQSITDPASARLTGMERPSGDRDAFVAP